MGAKRKYAGAREAVLGVLEHKGFRILIHDPTPGVETVQSRARTE